MLGLTIEHETLQYLWERIHPERFEVTVDDETYEREATTLRAELKALAQRSRRLLDDRTESNEMLSLKHRL